MKYFLLILSAITILGASNIAIAQNIDNTKAPAKQFKKHYIEIDGGLFLQSGADNDEYTRGARDIFADAFAENGRDDLDPNNAQATLEENGYLRLAYGKYVNEQFSVEFASTGISVKNTVTFGDTDENSNDDNSINSVDNYSINILGISGIYYIPIGDGVNATFRGGIGSYRWLDENVQPVVEDGVGQQYSGGTTLIGFGADIQNVHFEYRLYNLTLIDTYKGQEYQLYGTASVLTVGYKFRF